MTLLDGWDGQQTPDSAAAAFLNATWSHVLTRTFADEIGDPDLYPDGGDRWVEIMRTILDQPTNPWWDDVGRADQSRIGTRSWPRP